MTTTRTVARPVRPIRPRGRLFDRLAREVTSGSLPTGPGDERPVIDADLVGLPPAVQRYLRFMGVVGRPRDRILKHNRQIGRRQPDRQRRGGAQPPPGGAA